MTRRFNKWLLIVLIGVGLPFYWFFLDARVSDVPARNLSLVQLRAAASSLPGALPERIRYERVGRGYIPRNLLAAGTGLRPTPYAVKAYEVLYPGGESILIDAGTSPAAAARNNIDDYDRAAQARIDAAARRAAQRLTLADDPLHDGGLAGIAPATSQSAPTTDRTVFMQAVAPGVVSIELTGLAQGSRMVFVRLSDGREVLFTGDVAPIAESWKELRPPARAAMGRDSQDRAEIVSWLTTINRLKASNRALIVVAGHDFQPSRVIANGMRPIRVRH